MSAMGKEHESASEVVSPPAFPTIRSAAAMYLSISVVKPTGQSFWGTSWQFTGLPGQFLQALSCFLRLSCNRDDLPGPLQRQQIPHQLFDGSDSVAARRDQNHSRIGVETQSLSSLESIQWRGEQRINRNSGDAQFFTRDANACQIFGGFLYGKVAHTNIEFRDGGETQLWKITVGEVDWIEPTDRVHRAVNVGKEIFEEVVTFFLDRPDAEPQPEDDSKYQFVRRARGLLSMPTIPGYATCARGIQ